MKNEKLYLGDYLRLEFYTSLISAYKQIDGYCHFKREDLAKIVHVSKLDNITNTINKLVKYGYIENCTVNGYVMRIKLLNNKIICPDFIFNEKLSFSERGFLYCIKDCDHPIKLAHQLKIYSKYLNLEQRQIEKFLHNSRSIVDIKGTMENIKLVNIDIKNIYNNIKYNSNGYYFGADKVIKECIYCKKILHDNKNELKYGCCIDCFDLYAHDGDRISSYLYNRSKTNSNNYDFKYSLTKEYIKHIIENQNFKCAYSNMDFDYFNTSGVPTIDRIDSSKGYEIGNICIIRCDVNKMKSNYDLIYFKNIINNLSKNIENFKKVNI